MKHREHYRIQAVDAAQALAQILFEQKDASAAASVCEWGLRIDQYRDGLWRVLIGAYEATGQRAAAERARRSYGSVISELGIDPAAR